MSDIPWFETTAIIRYDPPRPGMRRRTEWWCVATVSGQIAAHMRRWVDVSILNPFAIPDAGLIPPPWGAHVSVIRGEKPPPSTRNLWKKHDGRKIVIRYAFDPRPGDRLDGGTDFWVIEVKSPEIIAIRDELGLVTRHPLHLTIGKARDPAPKNEAAELLVAFTRAKRQS